MQYAISIGTRSWLKQQMCFIANMTNLMATSRLCENQHHKSNQPVVA
jgi:hypothetical protein